MNDLKKYIGKTWIWIVFLIAFLGFLDIASDVFKHEIIWIDDVAYKWVHSFRKEYLNSIMIFITNLCSPITLLLICLCTFLFVKNKKISYLMFINLCLSTLLNIVFKYTFQRSRPIGYNLIIENGYSFPSGHSMVSMAFYGLIFYFIYKSAFNKKLKILLMFLISLLIFFIGISRIYLGVHFASDVIAGFMISIIYLILITRYIKKYNLISF